MESSLSVVLVQFHSSDNSTEANEIQEAVSLKYLPIPFKRSVCGAITPQSFSGYLYFK
jgi:hypothetical protein